MPLDLHKLKDCNPFVEVQILQRMVFEKALDPLRSAVDDYANVVFLALQGSFRYSLAFSSNRVARRSLSQSKASRSGALHS